MGQVFDDLSFEFEGPQGKPVERPLCDRLPARRIAIAAAVIFGAWLLCVRAYHQVIPSGASLGPYLLASDPGPILRSPDGSRDIQVVFNDAGAMHSGLHWTWLVVQEWPVGRRVVAEGYSHPDVRYGRRALPLRWLDDRTFEVEFAAGRHAFQPERRVTIQL